MSNTDASTAMIHYLNYEDKAITLIGTAHVSRASVQQVDAIITAEQPDTVCVELCASRYQSIRQHDLWQSMDIIKVIREKKAFLLLSNLLLASFQKRIARKLEIKPGEEMLRAVTRAEEIGAQVHLADRDIRVSLSRTWSAMSFWNKLKLLFQLLFSLGDVDDISAAEVEKLKQQDMLESILLEVGQSMPELRRILIDERDQYLAEKIRTAPGQKIVAVVGAGHVPGIKRNWDAPVNLASLESMPTPKPFAGVWKWIFPLLVGGLLIWGFISGGGSTSTQMLTWWVVVNGVSAGVGALLALAHPLTIGAAILAAPLTSLNPMMAAGWVSGLVEAMFRKPTVRDFENLPDDIVSIKGFWRNKITRILLVVVFTNLGSTAGTLVAIPLLIKLI